MPEKEKFTLEPERPPEKPRKKEEIEVLECDGYSVLLRLPVFNSELLYRLDPKTNDVILVADALLGNLEREYPQRIKALLKEAEEKARVILVKDEYSERRRRTTTAKKRHPSLFNK